MTPPKWPNPAAFDDVCEALWSLTNSADGLSFREDAIRGAVGNTNWRILRDNIASARSALSRARGEDVSS